MSYIGNSPGVASQRVTTTLTATAGQTQFTTQSGYVLGYVDVYLNGAKLVNGSDFEAITGTYVTLFAGASVGDVVELVSYVPRGLSDGYTKAEADAKFLDVGGDTASGALSLATATLSGNLNFSGTTQRIIGDFSNGNATQRLAFQTSTLNGSTVVNLLTNGTGTSSSIRAFNVNDPLATGNAYIGIQANATEAGIYSGNQGGGTYLPMTFYTGGTERIRVGTDGNVGIGLGGTTPSYQLDIAGTSSAAANNSATGSSTRFRNIFTRSRANSAGISGDVYADQLFHVSGGSAFEIYNADNYPLVFGTNSTERVRIFNDGNVSIGNSASKQKLHVKGRFNSDLNGDYYGLWGEGNTAANGYSFLGIGDWYTTSLYIQKQTGSSFAHIYNHNSTHNIVLQAGSGDNGTTSASGNVYIGTTATNTNSSKLVVNGTISQTVGGTQYLVVDQSDVGTAPNQIPLNQYLGSMAFQDRENINFLGGTGTLSSLDIAAISAQLNVSAVDVFVYDTSKDSDGGAWRKRTQHTSWYNETLNTATRGSRRDFPAVAVIVATADTVYILDGDTPDLPMWMVFVATRSPAISLLSWYTSGTGSVRAVCMLNGILSLAMAGGIMMPNFISDKFKLGYLSTKYAIRNNTIAQRNDVGGGYATTSTTEGYLIQDYLTNDIAMVVLPNAPVDPATQLPIPTIAVGCMGGLSIIQNDHTVTNRALHWASGGGGVFEIAFDKNGGYWFSSAYYSELSGNPNHATVIGYAPSVFETGAVASSLSGSNATNGLQYLLGTPSPNSNTSHWGAIAALWLVGSYQTADAGKILFTNGNHVGIQYGLSHFDTNKTSPTSGMVAYTTSKYATGWMPGRIKGAWLSDITQETITATDLSSRATFNGSGRTTSYSYTNGTNTATLNWDENEVDGYITIRMGGLVEGKNYVINVLGSATFTPTTGYSNFVRYVPTGQVLYQTPGSEQGSLATIMTFRALSSADNSHEFNIYSKVSGGNYTATFSIGEADLDRSVNTKGLQVFGNITKAPVAVGADLVGYGNNGVTTSYMKIPLSTNFIDLSTDFSVSFWLKSNGGSGYNGWSIAEDNQAGANGYDKTVINFFVQASDNCWAYRGKNINAPTDWIAQLNVWTHCVVTVKSGTVSFYANGSLVETSTGSGYNPSVPYSLYLHSWTYNTQFYGQVPIEFSLFRLSKTVPSQEQITKMYNDENYLFQPNAKATLHGTSDTITALAYDEDTQLLHVGTSSGRSVFDGLRRIDNTTTAVATAISAVDGLVVEN
jgi:hypothetical protein